MTTAVRFRRRRLLGHAALLGASWFALVLAWASRHEVDRGEFTMPEWRYLYDFAAVYLIFASVAAFVLLPIAFRASAPLRSLYVGTAISAVCVALSAPYGSLWGIVYTSDTLLYTPLALLWFAAPVPVLVSVLVYWARCTHGARR